MIKSQILNKRPFDLSDGELYLILIKNKSYSVFNSKYNNKPIVSNTLKEAKVYQNPNTAQKIITELFDNNEHYHDSTITLIQVKDLFEPRYYIKYKNNNVHTKLLPEIECYIDWFVKQNNPDTYSNYDEAQMTLQKYKRDLIEFYYNKITKLRNINLKKL